MFVQIHYHTRTHTLLCISLITDMCALHLWNLEPESKVQCTRQRSWNTKSHGYAALFIPIYDITVAQRWQPPLECIQNQGHPLQIHAKNNEIITILHHWSFRWYQWNPHTKCQQCGRCVHDKTASWLLHVGEFYGFNIFQKRHALVSDF